MVTVRLAFGVGCYDGRWLQVKRDSELSHHDAVHCPSMKMGLTELGPPVLPAAVCS
jgi:hypothetical protein